MKCPCCGSECPDLSRDRESGFRRARTVCHKLVHWWSKAKPVIQSGDAAHDLAGIVLIARAVVDLDEDRR